MSIKQSLLIPAIQLTAGFVAYLSTPANVTYRLGRTVFSNPTGAAQTVTACVVPNGGTATSANQVLPPVTVPAGGTYVSPELAGLVLPAGSSLQVAASLAAAIVMVASGVTIQ